MPTWNPGSPCFVRTWLSDLGRVAIEYGTVSADWMRNDEDLANLKSHPRYDELLARVEKRECANL